MCLAVIGETTGRQCWEVHKDAVTGITEKHIKDQTHVCTTSNESPAFSNLSHRLQVVCVSRPARLLFDHERAVWPTGRLRTVLRLRLRLPEGAGTTGGGGIYKTRAPARTSATLRPG
jgi:hypothetical protein